MVEDITDVLTLNTAAPSRVINVDPHALGCIFNHQYEMRCISNIGFASIMA